ncbi:preprotein translocase subunit SecG [Candidatus Saccharibacteria bacterium 32-49-10]|nr:MAG: preprotein translocase subunit SecG [Candidatus Saccharibacteria bacterium 32-49-10]
MSVETILPYITLGSAFLMVVSILLQQRGASLGAGFGASGELFTTRRGFDKNLFDVTIIFAVIFILSVLAGMVLPSFQG